VDGDRSRCPSAKRRSPRKAALRRGILGGVRAGGCIGGGGRIARLAGSDGAQAHEDLDATRPDVAASAAESGLRTLDRRRGRQGRSRPSRRPARNCRPRAPRLATEGPVRGKLRLDGVQASGDGDRGSAVGRTLAIDAVSRAGPRCGRKVAARWGRQRRRTTRGSDVPALRLAASLLRGKVDRRRALSTDGLAHGPVERHESLWSGPTLSFAKETRCEIPPMLARYPIVDRPLATWLARTGRVRAARLEGMCTKDGGQR